MANHPGTRTAAPHNQEFSPKHHQGQGRETLRLISSHKAALSFEVNIMMYLFLQFREILPALLMANFR